MKWVGSARQYSSARGVMTLDVPMPGSSTAQRHTCSSLASRLFKAMTFVVTSLCYCSMPNRVLNAVIPPPKSIPHLTHPEAEAEAWGRYHACSASANDPLRRGLRWLALRCRRLHMSLLQLWPFRRVVGVQSSLATIKIFSNSARLASTLIDP